MGGAEGDEWEGQRVMSGGAESDVGLFLQLCMCRCFMRRCTAKFWRDWKRHTGRLKLEIHWKVSVIEWPKAFLIMSCIVQCFLHY